MQEFYQKELRMIHDNAGIEIGGMRFEECTFDNCSTSAKADPEKISRVSNVIIKNGRVFNCIVGHCKFEDVEVNNLTVNSLLILWSPFFNRVKLTGNIGAIKINATANVPICPDLQAKFNEKRTEFYKNVDWALDISNARFVTFQCEGVPVDLIRRDTSSQVIVRKSKISSLEELGDNFKEEYPDVFFWMEMFLESPHQEEVMVTPLRQRPAKRRNQIHQGLMELRKLGIADAK